jgi:cytochrome c oxidase assembly protein subunit 15
MPQIGEALQHIVFEPMMVFRASTILGFSGRYGHSAAMSMYRPSAPAARPGAIARWLLLVALMIFAMVVIGGITRLTESGLSMVHWNPISGAIPPLNHQQWLAEFDAYRATPEYRDINRGMSLADFQQIFFWEYVHRLLGRLIGLVFALPLAWFWWRRAIPSGYGPRLVVLLALGGLQGAIGWWMVASGLVDRPDVSHIRLAIHLLTALLILGATLWTALDLLALARDPAARPAALSALGLAAIAVLVIQLGFGALTAGLDAGYAFSSWPLMGETLFPAGGWRRDWPALVNALDNPIVVQFVHRWFAFVALAAVIIVARAARRRGLRPRSIALHSLVGIQILLGIFTLLLGVPIPLAVTHQAVAVLLLATMIWTAHGLSRYHSTVSKKPSFA